MVGLQKKPSSLNCRILVVERDGQMEVSQSNPLLKSGSTKNTSRGKHEVKVNKRKV